jgi:Trypsin-co-occurring domain 2
MTEASEHGIGLADAIKMLRDEVLKARVWAAGSTVHFPVSAMTLELKVAATRSADGKAGFSIPFVNVELGGSAGWQRETMQTVTVTFGSPVDEAGDPVQVGALSDELKG